ncbi:MAG TPA: type II CAAX endopeptidase family protein [bacterium]
MTRDSRYPSIGQAAVLFACYLALTFGLGLLVHVMETATGRMLGGDPIILASISASTMVAVLGWGCWRRGEAARGVFAFRPVPAALIMPIVVTVLGLHVLLSEADNVVRAVWPMPEAVAAVFKTLVEGGRGMPATVLILLVAAPVVEELLFRGLILTGFLARYPAGIAVPASALVFTAFHLNPWQVVAPFVLGLLFAWWFLRTRSLLPAILGHAVNNAIPVLVSLVPSVRIPGYSYGGDPGGPAVFHPWWLNLAGVALSAAGLFWLIVLFRHSASRMSVVRYQENMEGGGSQVEGGR